MSTFYCLFCHMNILNSIALFDHASVLYFAQNRSLNETGFFIGFSELASLTTVIGFTLVIVTIFLYLKYYKEATGLLLSVAGSAAVDFAVKHFVARPRPMDTFIPAYIESGYSFPSGHTTSAVALYGFLIFLLWKSTATTNQKVLGTFVGGIVILGVGFSRVLLGVHYPSDVFAGAALGCLGVALGAYFSRNALAFNSGTANNDTN